jgi:cell wall-associated NlpC family hydrolase
MRGRLTLIAVAALALTALAFPATAGAAAYTDVPTAFWARGSVLWTVNAGWITPRAPTRFGVAHTASRLTAARVLASLYRRQTGTPVAADPFQQAVAAHWMTAGTGPDQPITQREFDRGVVRVLGLYHDAVTLGQLRTADGWKPPLPGGFGVEQVVRAIGARVNAPDGSDQWEEWPNQPLLRANLAVEAHALARMPSWARYQADSKTGVVEALPAWPPLKRAVLGFALRYAGAPYVWGGEYPTANSPYGTQAAGGFDCSGFVWWVMKMHTYHAGSVVWSGSSQILGRDTYSMARSLPVSRRVPRGGLHPGDILFWSSAPHGVYTSWTTVYHAGIYLGNGWTINSHGSGDGVTLDYMGAGAGWYHDAFAFGWRVMPLGK